MADFFEELRGGGALEERHLRDLWENLEDFWEDLDDPSFEGPWRASICAFEAIPEASLGWSFEGDVVLVNVHVYEAEPSDVTARFELGERLVLESFRVW